MRKSKKFYFFRNILVAMFKPFFEYERRNAVIETHTYFSNVPDISGAEADKIAKLDTRSKV